MLESHRILELRDLQAMRSKLQRDQQKLFQLVQFARYPGERSEFLHEYFFDKD